MSSNSNKSDKNKKQFPTLNINKEYIGKSAEQKPRHVRQYGMQHVGTLKGMRRMPPPANIPSIRAETGGNDPRVNLVPTGSSGWGGANGASSSPSEIVGNISTKSANPESLKEEKQDVTTNWASTTVTSTQSAATINPSQIASKQNIPFYGFQSEFPKLKSEEGVGVSMSTGGANDGRSTFSATGLAPVSLRPQTTPSNWLERQKVQSSVPTGGEEPAADKATVDSLGDATREFGMTENGLFDVTASHSALGMQKPFNSYSRQSHTHSFTSSHSAQKATINNPAFNSSRDQSSNNHQSDIAATGWAAVDDEPNFEEKIVFSDEEDSPVINNVDKLTDNLQAMKTTDNASLASDKNMVSQSHDANNFLSDVSSRNAESNAAKDEHSSNRPPVVSASRMPHHPREAWSGPPAQPFMPPYGHPFSYGNTSVMPPHPFYHTRMPLNNAMQPSNSPMDKESDVAHSDGLKEQRNARNQDYKLALERAQKKKQDKARQQKDGLDDQYNIRNSTENSIEGDNYSVSCPSVSEQPSSVAPGGPPIMPPQSTALGGVLKHQPTHMAPHIPPSMQQMPYSVTQRFVPWQNYPPGNPMHSVMPPTAIYPQSFLPQSTDPKLVEKFLEFLHQQQTEKSPETVEDGRTKDKVSITEQNDPFAEEDANDVKAQPKQPGRHRESSINQQTDSSDNVRPSSTSSPDQQHPRILKRESSLSAQHQLSEKDESKLLKNSQNAHSESEMTRPGDHKEIKSSIKKDDRNRKTGQSQPNSMKTKPQPLMEKPIQPANSEVRKFEEKVLEEEKRERNSRGNRSGWNDQQGYDYYYYENRGASHYRRNDQEYGYQWNTKPRSGVKRYNDEQIDSIDDYLESGRDHREPYFRQRGHPRDAARIPYHSNRGSRGRSYIRGGSNRGRYRETSSSHIRSKDSDNRRSGTSKTKKEKTTVDDRDVSEEQQKQSSTYDSTVEASGSSHVNNDQFDRQNRSTKNSKSSGSRANKKDHAKSKEETTTLKATNDDISLNTESKNDEKSELTAAPLPSVNIWNTVHPLIDNSKGNSSVNSDSNDKSEPNSASRSKQGTPSKDAPTFDDKSDKHYKEQKGGSKSGDSKHTKSERINYSKSNRRGGGSRRGGYDEWIGASEDMHSRRGYATGRRNYDTGHGIVGGSYRGDRSSIKTSRGGRASRGGYDGGGGHSSQANNDSSAKFISNKNGRDKRQASGDFRIRFDPKGRARPVSKDIVSDNNEMEEWETASEGSESMPSHRNDNRRGNGNSEYGGCSNRRGGGSGQGPGPSGGSASGSGSGNNGNMSSNYSVSKNSSSCGENSGTQNQNSSNGGKNHRMAGTNNNNTNNSANRISQASKTSNNEKPRSLPSHIEIHNIASVVDITNLPEVTEDEEFLYEGSEAFQEVISKTTRKKQKLEEQKRQNQIQEVKGVKGKLGDKKVSSNRLGTGRISKSINLRKPNDSRQSSKDLPPRLAKQKPTSPDSSTEKDKSNALKSLNSSDAAFGHSILNKNSHSSVIKPLLETNVLPAASLDTSGSAHRIDEKPVVIDSWDSRLADKLAVQKHKTDSSVALPKPIGTPAPAQSTTRSSVEKDSGSRDSGVDTGEAGSSNRSSPKGLPLRSDAPVSKSSSRSMPFISKQVKEVPVECDPPGLSTTYSSLDNFADKQEDELFAFCHLDPNEIDKRVSVVKEENCDNTSQERLDSKINSVKNLWYNASLSGGVDNRPLDISSASIDCASNSSTVQGLTVSYPSESESVSSSGVNSSSNQTNICKVRPQLQQQQQPIDQRSSVTPTHSPLENVSSGDGVAIATSNASSNPSTFATSNASQLLPFSSTGNATFANFYAQPPQPIYQQQDMLSNNCFSVEPALQGNRWSTNGALPNTSTAYGYIQQPQRPSVNIPKPMQQTMQQPMMTQPGAQQQINYNPVIMHKFVSMPPSGHNLQQNQSQIAPVQFAAGGTPRGMPGDSQSVANNSLASQLFAFYQRQNSATCPQPSIQLATQSPLQAASNLPQSGNSSGFHGSSNIGFSGASASGVNMPGSNMLTHQNTVSSFPQQMKPSQAGPFAFNRQQTTPQQSAFPTLGSNPTLAASMSGFAGSSSLQPAMTQYGYHAAPNAPKNLAASSQAPLQFQSSHNRGLDSLSTEFPYSYPLNSGFASDLASNAYNNSSGSMPAFNNMPSDNIMGFKAIPQSQGYPPSFQSTMFPPHSNVFKSQSSQPSTSQVNSISTAGFDNNNHAKAIVANDPQRSNLIGSKDLNQSMNYTKFPNPKGTEETEASSIFTNSPFSANQREKRSYQQNSHINSSQKQTSKNVNKGAPQSYNRKNSSPVAGTSSVGYNLGYENTQMTTETAGVLANMAPEELQRFVMQMRNGPVAAFNQPNSAGSRNGPSRGYQDFDNKKGTQNKRPGNNFPSKFSGGNRPPSRTNVGMVSNDNPESVVDESKDSEPNENKDVDSPPVSSLNRPVVAES